MEKKICRGAAGAKIFFYFIYFLIPQQDYTFRGGFEVYKTFDLTPFVVPKTFDLGHFQKHKTLDFVFFVLSKKVLVFSLKKVLVSLLKKVLVF